MHLKWHQSRSEFCKHSTFRYLSIWIKQSVLQEYVSHLDSHPQVSVGDVAMVHVVVRVERCVSAVDLKDAAVMDSARVIQLVEDVACLVFDEDGGGG